SVGMLTELAPHKLPHLQLGLNVNTCQAIKLRLWMGRYDKFLLYNDVWRVLCHERTQQQCKQPLTRQTALNSHLNWEVAELECLQREGTCYLLGSGDVHTPSSELEAQAQAHVLDGGLQTLGGKSREERR
ncbi:hypothetical protein WOLCODRAFT_81795, partial [Wolfiporia cocos MD-104 SS10]